MTKLLLLFTLLFPALAYSQYNPANGAGTWQGVVASAGLLPASGNVPGDVRVETTAFGMYVWNGASWSQIGGGGGGGTVTSVGLTLPASVFSVAGSPITGAGTLAGSLLTQSANTVFAGPTSGGPATPAFRALVAADLPAGTGTVTSLSVVSANGLAGSVVNPTTTPAITLSTTVTGILQGNGTVISAATTGNFVGTGFTVTGGTNAVLGAGVTLSVPVTNDLYVRRYGTDAAGCGPLVNPCHTVGYALGLVTLPSSTNDWVIHIMGRNDAETGNLLLQPYTWIEGESTDVGAYLRLPGGDYIGISNAAWQVNGRGGIRGVYLGGGTSVDLDFAAAGGAAGSNFELDDVQVTGTLNHTGRGVNGGDYLYLQNAVVYGAATLTGDQLQSQDSYFYSSFAATTSATVNTDLTFVGGIVSGNFGLTETNAQECSLTSVGTGYTGTFTTTGTITLNIDENLPVGYSLSGGTTRTNYVDAKSLAYTPTTSANWNSVPALTSVGLDDLAGSGIVKSQAQNLFLASPNGSAGVPSFRAIVAGDLPAGTGTVTSVSVASSNGFAGTVATSTTTPVITMEATPVGIIKSNGNAISAAVSGTDYQAPISTSSAPANEFATGFTAPNTFTYAQPSFANLSGNITAAQMLALPQNDLYIGNVSNQPVATAVSGDLSNVAGAFTVNTVGGSSAANIHTAALVADTNGPFTSGSIFFADASGHLQQDNANLVWSDVSAGGNDQMHITQPSSVAANATVLTVTVDPSGTHGHGNAIAVDGNPGGGGNIFRTDGGLNDSVLQIYGGTTLASGGQIYLNGINSTGGDAGGVQFGLSYAGSGPLPEYDFYDDTVSVDLFSISNSGALGIINYQDLTEIATPANPTANHVRFYSKAGDGLYYLNHAGVEKQLSVGGGTVTSVAFSDGSTSPIFTISGSPVTTSGTLTETLSNQNANLIFAGPSSGGAAQPTFRALVGADLPNPSATTLGGIESYVAVSHQFLTSITTSGVPVSAQPAFTDISGSLTAAQMLPLTTNHIYVGAAGVPADVAMSGDASIVSSGALTLATVNASPGTYTNATVTVNGKGLVTSASSGASLAWNMVYKTSTYTASAYDSVLADESGGAFTVTIPLAASNANKCIRLKKVDSSATAVTIAASGSDIFDISGTSSISLVSQTNSIEICAYGTGSVWEVF